MKPPPQAFRQSQAARLQQAAVRGPQESVVQHGIEVPVQTHLAFRQAGDRRDRRVRFVQAAALHQEGRERGEQSFRRCGELRNARRPRHLARGDPPARFPPVDPGDPSESLGDYCAGPNHVLPTSGTARFSSPLGVYDFVKRSSLIEVTQAGANVLGPVAAELAYGEGLQAHARAAEMRLQASAAAADLPLNADRIARTVRQDVTVHARLCHPAQRRPREARRDGEPVPPAARTAARTGRTAGPRGHQPLPGAARGRLAAALTRFAGLPAGCRLMLGNGSDELIDLLSVACDVPGATMLAPLPGFVMYEMSAQLRGLRFVGVPLTADFELDEAAMLAAIEQHRPASPTSPTRTTRRPTCSTTRSIERIVAAVGAQHGLVVFDEAYQPFSSRSWMPRLAAARPCAGDAHAVASSASPACAWATCAAPRR